MGFAACALILTSCSKSDVTDNIDANKKELKFSVVAGSATKAVEKTAFTVGAATGVLDLYAFYAAGTATMSANDPYFTESLTMAAGPVWSTSRTRFLPDGGANFFATWPVGAAVVAYTAASTSYGFEYSAATPDTDLMGAFTAVGDPDVAGPAVALNMRHLLSQVNFGVYAYQGTQITISNISINGITSNGAFKFGATDAQGSWSAATTPATANYDYTQVGGAVPAAVTAVEGVTTNDMYIFGDAGKAAVGTTAYYWIGGTPAWTNNQTTTTLANSLMLMPQVFAATTPTVNVTFDWVIKDYDGVIVGEGTDATFTLGDFAVINSWLPNKRYVYMISFETYLDDRTPDFSVTVVEWENHNGNAVGDGGTGVVDAGQFPIAP